MDIVDAARDVTRALAVRWETDGGADAVAAAGVAAGDGDAAGWLVARAAEPGHADLQEALRSLAARPGDSALVTEVVGRLVMKAAADRAFAEELTSSARLCAPAGADTRQQALVEGSGVAVNSGGDMDVSGARVTGRDDASGRFVTVGRQGTLIDRPTFTVAGEKSRIFVGGKLSKRKIFLVPFGFFVRVGRKAGTAAAAHPAVAAACTVIVVGGASGAVALAQGSGSGSLSTSPAAFSGLWRGTVSETGKDPGGYDTEVAITGGPVSGTVGSVNLPSLSCTSALTLSEAHEQELKISDSVTSGSCGSGTLVLTVVGNELRYTLTHADGTTATGLLKHVESFAASAPAPSTAAPPPKPLQVVTSGRPVIPLASNGKGYTLPGVQYPAVVSGSLAPDVARKLDIAMQQPIEDWANAVLSSAASSASGVTYPPGPLPPTEQTTVTTAGLLASVIFEYEASDDLGGGGGQIVLVRGDTDAVVPAGDILTPAAKEASGLQRITDAVNAAAKPSCSPLTADALAKDLSPQAGEIGPAVSVGAEPGGLDFLVEPGRQNCGIGGSGPAGTVFVPFSRLSGLVDPEIVALAEARTGATAPATSPTTGSTATAGPSGLANGPDCGLTAEDLGGDHLILLQGALTCAQAQGILTDYLKDTSNWQGSGGFDTVDGMQCGHSSVAGRASSGVWVSCGTPDTGFETKRPS